MLKILSFVSSYPVQPHCTRANIKRQDFYRTETLASAAIKVFFYSQKLLKTGGKHGSIVSESFAS